MNKPSQAIARLRDLRSVQTQQIQQRVNYQRGLCQRYRNNIQGLERLIGYRVPATTSLQRDNQQNYRLTLYKMLELQRKELEVAEQSLGRIEQELLQAARDEKVLDHFIQNKLALWHRHLASQEQKIQDGLAAQSYWQGQMRASQ
ncbi:MAG: flagellar export protein FliJ [Cellvibrio sp.]